MGRKVCVDLQVIFDISEQLSDRGYLCRISPQIPWEYEPADKERNFYVLNISISESITDECVDTYVYSQRWANIDQNIWGLLARNCDGREKSREGESRGGERDGLRAGGHCM